jgi:hypothetical protein
MLAEAAGESQPGLASVCFSVTIESADFTAFHGYIPESPKPERKKDLNVTR